MTMHTATKGWSLDSTAPPPNIKCSGCMGKTQGGAAAFGLAGHYSEICLGRPAHTHNPPSGIGGGVSNTCLVRLTYSSTIKGRHLLYDSLQIRGSLRTLYHRAR